MKFLQSGSKKTSCVKTHRGTLIVTYFSKVQTPMAAFESGNQYKMLSFVSENVNKYSHFIGTEVTFEPAAIIL